MILANGATVLDRETGMTLYQAEMDAETALQTDGRESGARPGEMRQLRRLCEDVPAEVPEAFRRQTRFRSAALHPVFLLPGTLPERRDRAADDADDAVRESGRPAVPRTQFGGKQINNESDIFHIFPSRTEKKRKKSAFFLETDWKNME